MKNPAHKMKFFAQGVTVLSGVFALGCVANLQAERPLWPEPPRLAPPDESAVQRVLHVALGAEDGGTGTERRPFGTVQRALEEARRDGRPTKVWVGPGVYRETLDITGRGEDPLLVIEAKTPGTAVVSGSDVFTGWEARDGKTGQFEHRWEHRFGWEANPWPGLMPMDRPGFRHELLFVEGRPMRQVYADEELAAGTYWVDEDGGRVVLALGEGEGPEGRLVEVSVRPLVMQGAHSKLLRIFQRDNVVVRGLIFRHARTSAFAGAVQALSSRNLLFEDVRSEWNSGGGVLFGVHGGVGCENVVLRRVWADHNGYIGLTGGFHDGLIEGGGASYNNWRGVALGATGWAPCGWKLSGLNRVVIRDHRAIGNHASGGWLDDHIEHVLIEGFTGMNNLRSGLSVEAVEGPLVVRGAVLAGNSTGLNLFDSRHLTLESSLLVDNTSNQLRLSGSTPMESEALERVRPNWRRERLSKRQPPSHIVLRGNGVGVTQVELSGGRLVRFGMRENAFLTATGERPLQVTLDTLVAEGMVYGHPQSERAAVFSDVMDAPVTLSRWQILTGQDEDARFDGALLARSLADAVKRTGVAVQPYVAPDPLAVPAGGVDRLEL